MASARFLTWQRHLCLDFHVQDGLSFRRLFTKVVLKSTQASPDFFQGERDSSVEQLHRARRHNSPENASALDMLHLTNSASRIDSLIFCPRRGLPSFLSFILAQGVGTVGGDINAVIFAYITDSHSGDFLSMAVPIIDTSTQSLA